MKRFNLFQKMMATLLALVLVVGMLPMVSVRTSAAPTAQADTRVADPSTMNQWQDYFGPNVLSTEFAGGVWTDKSVMTNADEFMAQISMSDPNNHFLVALSALAANQKIIGYSASPIDVMLVLDVSGSMQGDKATTMVRATNETIHSLLAQNNNNRVGVVLYSGNSNTGNNAGTNTATVILPLGRYTTTSTQTVTVDGQRIQIPAYFSISNNRVSVAGGVRNGNEAVSGSKSVSGGTYIQNGLYKAWGEFSKVTDVKVPQGQPQAGAQRTPIMVLLSDGQPTLATRNYNNIGTSERTYGDGSEGSTTWQTVFLTQLTASWVKGKMQTKYGTTPKFYTLGLGTGNSNYATAVLQPGTSYDTLDDYWENYFDTSKVDEDNNVEIIPDTSNWWEDSNEWTVYKDATVTDRNYSDMYKLASNTDELLEAFKSVVESIELDAAGHVTLVESAGEDFSGYVTITDEIGIFMDVKDVKGLVIGDTLFTGHELAESLQNSTMGDMENPTEYGHELIRTVCERLGITDTATAQQLVIAAYADGQLAFSDNGTPNNESDDTYSNYIGWYSNGAGEYLGFWDKDTGITAEGAPAGATWINKSYGYLGAAGSSDMMHVVVMLSTHIESGMQVMQFKVPASLIPMVTYEVELEESDPTKMKSLKRNEAFPIRLVYEVGLNEGINAVNVAQKVDEAIEAGYGHSHLENGTYAFYTNKWGAEHGDSSVDYNDPLGHEVAQSHFHPAVGNDRYYYTENTPVYVKNGNSYVQYTGDAAPAGTGYYRAHHYYTSAGYTTEYLPMSTYALQQAAALGKQADGYWYIPEGAIFQQIDRFRMLKGGDANGDGKADANLTGTLEYYDYPVVVDVGDKYDTYAFLGNNGKLTITPAQGIKLTKTVTEPAEGAPETFTFKVTLSEAVAAPNVTDADGNALTGWSVDGNVITVQLKAGETVCITGLPTGVTYTVEEEVTKYYAAASTNATGTVEAYTIHGVDFVNAPKGYGNLIVSKDVDHPFVTAPDALVNKEFTIHVQLTGEDVANKEFAIAGSEETVKTDANGSFTVTLKDNGSLTVVGLPEGTTFTTTETLDPAIHAGFTMDADRSTLTGTILKDQTVQAHVVNDYEPQAAPTTLNVAGNKHLVDEAGAFDWTGKSFTIRLEEYDPEIGTYTTVAEQQVTDGALTFNFSDFETFDTLGSYFFKVSEVIPAETDRLEGMSYDATVGRFEVVVTDEDVDGQLEIKVYDFDTRAQLAETNGTVTYTKDFTNTHTTDATFVEFTVEKDVLDPAGVGISEAGFLFNLYEVVDGVTAETPAYSMRTVLVDGQGQVTFHIPVTKVGVRTFVLKEDVPSADTPIPGMVYDTSEYLVTVTTTAEDGKLVSTASITKDGQSVEIPVFTNVIDLEPISLNPFVTKELQGREPMANDSFQFFLEQTDGSFVPGSMPNGYTDTAYVTYDELVNLGGKATFDAITVAKVGTYYFRCTEVAGNVGGMTYDGSIYHITVTISAEGDQLTRSISVVKVGQGVVEDTTNGAQFVNTYLNTDTAEVQFTGNKNLSGRDLITGEFSFQLKDAQGNVLQTVSNLANGSFSFDPITYTVADIGTHTYTVSEIKGSKGGVQYDTTVYTITVTVFDNGAGELIAQVQGADSIRFNNTYSYGGPVYVALSGTKSWHNTDADAGKAMQGGEFTFVLHSSDETYSTMGAAVATAVNGADGSIAMGLSFSQPGKYYYLLSEQIPQGEDRIPGASYDTAVYQIGITVYDNGQGALVGMVSHIYKVGTGSNEIAFGNLYTPVPATVVIDGEKELTGRTLLDGEFDYELVDAQGNVLETVTNENGKFAFSQLSFDKSGTYVYTVREVTPAEAVDGVYDGIKYDDSVFTATVTVSDNGNGQLIAQTVVTEGQTETDLKFENTYTVTGIAEFSVFGKKTIKGMDLKDRHFSFELLDANGVRVALVHNNAAGEFSFVGIPLTTVGEHTFTVKEVNDAQGGITYDARIYTVTVTAEDDGRGGLIAGVPIVKLGDNAAALEFANEYKVTETEAQFRVEKILTGDRTALSAGEFTFELMDASGKVIQTQGNLVAGGVRFDPIVFTAPGTYTYTIREVIPADAVDNVKDGMTYDAHTCTVTVEVVDNGDGTLTATVRYTGLPQFTNTYKVTGPTSVDISGTKELTGKQLTAGMFRFELLKDGKQIATAQNDANGGFVFEDVVLETLGTHTFTVKELVGNAGGMTYDTREYTVIVHVTDDGKGGMVAGLPQISYHGVATELKFVNVYQVTEPTTTEFGGTKVLTGKNLTDGMFSFELYDAQGNLLQTVTNVGGTFSFQNVPVTALGENVFTVRETIPADAVENAKDGITYDPLVYTVKVNAVDNGEGGLRAEEPRFFNGEQAINGITFTNTYTTEPTEIVIGGTKELTGKQLTDGMFTFELLKDGKVIHEASNVGGKFTFDAITLDAAGEFVYTIREKIPAAAVNNTQDGITYDAHECTVTVTVTDNGDGTLSANVSYDNAAFTNVYAVTDPTSVDISGTKELTGKQLTAGMFRFELLKDGKQIATTENDANGGFVFENVELNALGDHTFTVKEIKGNAGGITYDPAEYTVTVTVTDNGRGGMVAGTPVITKNGTAAELVFTNTYEVTGTTETSFGGTKQLLGVKALTDGLFTFELYDAQGNLLQTVANVGGTFSFRNVPVTALGENVFTVRETIPADAVENAKDGITYDPLVYTVKVNAVDNGEGGLSAQTPAFFLGEVPVDAISFTNRYDVKGTSVTLTGTKILTGKQLEDGMFAFELLKDGQRVALAQNVGSTFTFENIPLETLGDHFFTIRELVPEEAVNGVYNGITYSGAEYVVDVSLTTSDDGVGGMIVSTPVYTKENATVAEPVFENSYAVTGAAQITLTGTKSLTGGIALEDGVFQFEVHEGDVLLATATNQNGSFTFENVKLTTLGEHVLTVTERKGDEKGITYSELVYTVTVNVIDNGDGTMSAETPVITLDGQTVDTIAFENVFTPDDITVSLDIVKTVENKTAAQRNPKGFQFVLVRDGKTLQTVTSDAQGKASMKITLTSEDLKAGTVKFQVKELDTDEQGVIYSTKVYDVTVTLTQGADGQLNAQVKVDGKETQTPVLSFTNVYDPPATPTTGDSSNPGLYLMFFGISALGVVILLAVLIFDKKKRKTE